MKQLFHYYVSHQSRFFWTFCTASMSMRSDWSALNMIDRGLIQSPSQIYLAGPPISVCFLRAPYQMDVGFGKPSIWCEISATTTELLEGCFFFPWLFCRDTQCSCVQLCMIKVRLMCLSSCFLTTLNTGDPQAATLPACFFYLFLIFQCCKSYVWQLRLYYNLFQVFFFFFFLNPDSKSSSLAWLII